jgi:hypothetical protein
MDPKNAARTPSITPKMKRLLDAGESTYEVGTGRQGRSILCRLCDKRSFNQNDINHKFCGHCKVFHEDIRVAYELLKHVKGDYNPYWAPDSIQDAAHAEPLEFAREFENEAPRPPTDAERAEVSPDDLEEDR